MQRLSAKLKFQREYIEPHLGNLTPLYRHTCTLFIGTQYVGKGYGIYSDRLDDYDAIGSILARI